MARAALEDLVREAVAATVGERADVDSVTITPAGRRRVVRIALDRPVEDLHGDTPVDPLSLDEIADLTRDISAALDGDEDGRPDVMGAQPYTLEVTTPGVERPLTTPEHLRRAVGRLLLITTAEEEVLARLLAITSEGLEVETAPTSTKGAKASAPRRLTIPSAAVERARVEVEFTRPDQPTEES